MTSQLMKKAEREKLSELFRAFDKNSDGKIDKAELKDGYENLMGKIMSDDEVESIFTKIDIDSSGFIDYNEFYNFIIFGSCHVYGNNDERRKIESGICNVRLRQIWKYRD